MFNVNIEPNMEAQKLSPKYQVVIPKTVRESLHLTPGQPMQVFEFGGAIQIVPQKTAAEMRGFVKGINTQIDKEADRH